MIYDTDLIDRVQANFLQRPPIDESQYLFEDVYFNPYVIQLANA